MTNHDPINSPSHYAEGRAYEPIDVIADWDLNYHLGNACKYISRAGRKQNRLEDLKKARWYIDREIQTLEQPVPFAATCNSIRVYELAHELGLSNREVLEACDSLDINVKGHSSSLNEHQASKIRDILLVPFATTYEDVLEDQILSALEGNDPYETDIDDQPLDGWGDDDYLWDPSLGPVELAQAEIDAILAKKDLDQFHTDEIVSTVERRGLIIGFKKDGSSCLLNSNGTCQ